MIFKKWSKKIAAWLFRNTGENDEYKKALTSYSLEGFFSAVLSIIVLFLLVIPLGIFKTAVFIGFTAAVIKSLTGGLHLSTPLRCAVWGAITITGISYVALHFPLTTIPLYIMIGLLMIMNGIVWKKAPHESEGKPLTDHQKVRLALFSRILIAIITVVCIMAPKFRGVNELFYGTVFQTANLLKLTAKISIKVDRFAAKLEKRAIF